jgi:hypothetical protein
VRNVNVNRDGLVQDIDDSFEAVVSSLYVLQCIISETGGGSVDKYFDMIASTSGYGRCVRSRPLE